MSNLELNIYGIHFILSLDEKICQKIQFSFGNFSPLDLVTHSKIIRIQQQKSGSINTIGSPIFRNQDFTIFEKRNKRSIYYNDYGIIQIDYDKDEFVISSDNEDFIHESTYLIILSRLGKILDLAHIHKMHAMSCQKNNVLSTFIGPSGAGKSTLLLNLLLNHNYKLVSDDLTFFKSQNCVLSFPLRIGIPKNFDINILKDYQTSEIVRRKYGQKYLLSSQKFLSESKNFNPQKFYLLQKGNRKIKRPSYFFEKIYFLLKYLVIGVDTPMILEIFWETGLLDFLNKAKILMSRFRLMIKLLLTKEFETLGYKSEKDLIELLNLPQT